MEVTWCHTLFTGVRWLWHRFCTQETQGENWAKSQRPKLITTVWVVDQDQEFRSQDIPTRCRAKTPQKRSQRLTQTYSWRAFHSPTSGSSQQKSKSHPGTSDRFKRRSLSCGARAEFQERSSYRLDRWQSDGQGQGPSRSGHQLNSILLTFHN